MVPGAYNLPITENSVNVQTFAISGIATAVDYSAMVDIRASESPTSALLLSLTSPSDGLTLASDGSSLTVTLTMTEAQADTLAPLVDANPRAAWSLKVTSPTGVTLQYLKGLIVLTRTPTA